MTIININEQHEQMTVQLSTNSWKIKMCVAYGLQESRSTDDEIDEWYYQLEKSTIEYEHEPFLIIGDLNAHIGNDSRGISYNTPEINANGRKLRDMMDRRNLTLVNGTEI